MTDWQSSRDTPPSSPTPEAELSLRHNYLDNGGDEDGVQWRPIRTPHEQHSGVDAVGSALSTVEMGITMRPTELGIAGDPVASSNGLGTVMTRKQVDPGSCSDKEKGRMVKLAMEGWMENAVETLTGRGLADEMGMNQSTDRSALVVIGELWGGRSTRSRKRQDGLGLQATE